MGKGNCRFIACKCLMLTIIRMNLMENIYIIAHMTSRALVKIPLMIRIKGIDLYELMMPMLDEVAQLDKHKQMDYNG